MEKKIMRKPQAPTGGEGDHSPIQEEALASPASRGLWKNKYFLYATAFFSGMSVMAVELGASRLLAPYFSSSQIVWTVIIGAIMIAMALGNVLGGRMADKDPDPARMFRRLLLAACWIAAIPFLGKYVIAAVSVGLALVVEKNFLIWASLLSCLLIFVFPLMLLGTVTPSLMKFTVSSLNENGKTVGELEALNTIGSIIGTFVPTFVTIPTVGTSATFLIFAAILAVLCLTAFLSIRRYQVRGGAAVAVIAALALVPSQNHFAFWEKDLAYEGESIYNYLQVKETPRSVILSTNVLEGVQSIKRKDASLTGMYYDYALAAPLMAGISPGPDTGAPPEILILGLGTGTYAAQCGEFFPSAQVDGVEIDEKIIQLARDYFDLPETVRVHAGDGRAFLQSAGEARYDVIMVDAYQDITIPFQMSSVEFFQMAKSRLKEDGCLVVNLNMHSGQEGSINEYLSDTIASIFPYAYTAVVPNQTNQVLFASGREDMADRLARQVSEMEPGTPLRDLMERVESQLIPVQGGTHILTDDKAPVELLGVRMIDSLISQELESIREMFRTGDWKGLLSQIG